MSYAGNKGLSSMADTAEETKGVKLPPSSRYKERGADDVDESANMATKRTLRSRNRAIIDDSDSEPAKAQVSKHVSPHKGKAISKPTVSESQSLPTVASTRPRVNTKAATKPDTDLDDNYTSAGEEKDTKGNKVVPRLIDGKVVGSTLTPEEFLEKQKRGHWGTGRIGKNKSPNRRKRRVGATPTKVDEMDAGDWIIVNMHLDNKTWKDIDTAWSTWNQKPSSAKDYTVVRNRYEKLEALLCAELNLDVNTNFLLGAIHTLRKEKKTLDDDLIAYQAQHAEKVRKLQDEKFDRIATIMKDLGAKEDFTPTAVSVRYHFLTNRRYLNDEGKWTASPLDITTPGAATAVRMRAPKKRPASGTNATPNALGESSPGKADAGNDEQEYDDYT